MTEYNDTQAAQAARNQDPEVNTEKPAERPEVKPVYSWPDSLTIHHLLTELATEEAAGEMELGTVGFRFSGSMYDHSPDLGRSLRLAPGINAAVDEAVRGYNPSDMLQYTLDREMLDLAGTARDLLPEGQWDRLRQAAKEDLQRRIGDQAAGT